MKKSWLVILSCILFVSIILAGCGSPQTSTVTATSTSVAAVTSTATSTVVNTTTTTQNQIIIKIGGGVPQGHAISVSILDWKSKLEAATNGRVKVTFYEAGTMGKSTELYDLCVNNTLQAAHIAEFWANGRFPIVEGVDNSPFTFASLAQQTQTLNTLYDRGLLAKEAEPFKLMYFTSVGTVNLFTAKKKITTMADFAGQKIRASGTNVKTVELLGGTALTVPGDEEYMDLDKGILTGNLTGSDNVVARKEYEVLKYGIKDPISAGAFYFVMNKNFWNSLPADIQAAIEKLNKEESAAHVATQGGAQSAAWDTCKSKGMDTYNIDPAELAKWKQATSSVLTDFLKNINGKGLPGDQVLAVIKEVTGK
jgi:TRAP-type transport system periplasmic protein